MCKRMTIATLCLTLLLSAHTSALASETAPGMLPEDTSESAIEILVPEDTTETAVEVLVPDGTEATSEEEAEVVDISSPEVYLEGVLLENAHGTLIDGSTYVSFAALVSALRPDAVITWETDRAVARAEGLEISAQPSTDYICANDRYLYVPSGVQVGTNEVLVPVRTIVQALGGAVWWDNSVRITASGEPFLWAEEVYDDYDLSLLTAIIYCESGSQPLEGKIAVGNVILNRVESPLFPSTIYDVLVEPNQFYGTVDGILERTPNEESIIAAKICLEGTSVLPNAYWFNGVGKTFWASQNKTLITVIGGHAFYG